MCALTLLVGVAISNDAIILLTKYINIETPLLRKTAAARLAPDFHSYKQSNDVRLLVKERRLRHCLTCYCASTCSLLVLTPAVLPLASLFRSIRLCECSVSMLLVKMLIIPKE